MKNILFIALISLIAFTGCNKPNPVKTIEDLKAGIKGETTASAKYAAFAQKASEEGNANIAKLFAAASKAESIHAETYEATTMYPQFLADAKAEKVGKAEKSFSWAFDTEKKHKDFYFQALQALNAGTQNTLPVEYAVCPVCGNTYDKAKLDEKCAFCQTNNEKFIPV
jgi:rubrerythrin